MALVTHKPAGPGAMGNYSKETRKEMAAILDADVFDDIYEEVNEEDGHIGTSADMIATETDDNVDNYTTVKDVTTISRSQQFQKMLADIERITAPNAVIKDAITREDPEYDLIHQAMKSCVELQVEIGKVHRFIRGKYKKYYPELEQLVVEPLQYARAVKVVDFGFDLEGFVDGLREAGHNSNNIVKIIVTRSTCKPVENPSPNEKRYILEACDEMMSLELAKQFVLEYTQLRMNHLAPNVSAIIGTAIAAQMIGIVGGLDNLTKLPAEHIMHLGRTKRNREHEKAEASLYHGAFLLNTDIVRSQEPDFKDRALKMVANKVILAARVDATRYASDGSRGAVLREKILKQIEGIMDGTIASTYKPKMTRKRPRETQDMAILAAARQATQQQLTYTPKVPDYHINAPIPPRYPTNAPQHFPQPVPKQPRTSGVRML
eukprot:TRINITY_DN10596_c1_g2_i1.p1 TRINITY_DN10596_c1_g2~~TRINITY_DN10596_c1_g2_i1.p1  ORF type:complete len:434 (+),score=99.28 TRINITY_DN10596_c1_g2_i1:43-1344(+)